MNAAPGKPTRRRFLATAATAAFLAGMPSRLKAGVTSAKVVVIGGGYAGATVARFLRAADPRIGVTLIEPNRAFCSCPFSNAVIGGLEPFSVLRFGYGGVEATGVRLVFEKAARVDPAAKTVRTEGGLVFAYDRLIVAPGIEFVWNAIAGYDEAASEVMPHAWKAGPQTLLLRKQIEAMPDDGVVAIAPPTNPFRCPPGPYERASLIAHYLKIHKPRAKLLILDAKEYFSKEILFRRAWKELYGDLIEWHSVLDFGPLVAVKPKEKVLVTETREFRVDVANIIPPQRAGGIALETGLADETGWCPIDPVTFESRLQPNIHVLGDASIAGAMPKSAFSANAQGKICAVQVARLLNGEGPIPTKLDNVCYSLVGPGYGISIAGVYRQGEDMIEEIEGAGGISPIHAPAKVRLLEAGYAEDWFRSITGQVFG
ncbi:NAD(P)/FAD-dependent oxidoreductase [Methyloceanibacter sp.]|uniref:NAD(P)/FAD-dependent oxidoreductase n=1 Tax=Methyloceanibacter sp. TaxID=1965321 RepID=UPI002C9D2E67|nr:NAD(P)/FAD-dependent oxidoreductase [Methyloceanibacter sp.]HML91380.1 NAD(P)/FAD-dependent oxidoreductase [Methyloceanibacter sp.]